MSGQNGPDEAARLELALERIARAAPPLALHDMQARATSAHAAPHSAHIAARLDRLIAEVRHVLGAEA